MELKFAPFCSTIDVILRGIIYLVKVKTFTLWLKTMGYDYIAIVYSIIYTCGNMYYNDIHCSRT